VTSSPQTTVERELKQYQDFYFTTCKLVIKILTYTKCKSKCSPVPFHFDMLGRVLFFKAIKTWSSLVEGGA